VLRPASPAIGALGVFIFSTAIGFRRLQSPVDLVRRFWPVVLVTSVAAAALSRTIAPILTWMAISAGLGALAAVWAIDLHRALAANRRVESPDLWEREWQWPLALWTVGASILISKTVFHAIPHVPDEVGYWFHAKYFAAGQLWLPAPPEIGAFALPNVMAMDGKWFSIFPPGWPAVLALGFLAGAPTLVNPVLAGLTVALLFRLIQGLYGTATANIACALLALSPMFLLMSAGLMSHPLSALCTVAAAGSLHRAWRTRSPWFGLLAGGCLGFLLLTRVFDAALICLAVGAYALTRWKILRARKLVGVSLLVPIGVAVAGVALLAYDRVLTGRTLTDPIALYFDAVFYPGGNRLGFGPDIGNFGWGTDLMPGHSLVEAVLNAHMATELLHFELFGWAVGSLAPLVIYVMWGRRLWQQSDALFLAVVAATVVGQGFYWYPGTDYGARYWYQLLVPCCVLAARVLAHASPLSPRLAPAALVLSAIGALVFLPWRAATKYVGYRGMNASVIRLASDCPMTNALVLVHDASDDSPFWAYGAAAILNEPGFPSGAPVFARDVSHAVTHALQVAFPGRPVWTIAVAREPFGRAQLVENPASAGAGCRSQEAHLKDAP
jgi:hypothetical protein